MIVKLTTKFDNEPIWIMTDSIEAFYPYEGGTRVFVRSNPEDPWDIKEAPEEIVALIKEDWWAE